jgi:hypothetical protein
VVEEAGVPGENHRLGKATVKRYNLPLRVECTTFCKDITEILLKVALNTMKQTNKLTVTLKEIQL